MFKYIKERVTRIKKREFIKSIATLASGILLGQIISTIGMPVISRIYTPETLGEFNIINSTGGLINGLLCLGLLAAVMIPEKDEDAVGICKIIILALGFISTLFLIIVLILSPYCRIFEVGFNYYAACILLWLLLITTNISSIYYSYINRKKMYGVLFWNPVIGALSNVVIRIALGLLGLGGIGYLVGVIASSAINVLHMSYYVNPFHGYHTTGRLRGLFKIYSEFTLFQMPSNMISNISGQIPFQLIARFFGNTILGNFSIALSILSIPVNLLSVPINRVYYRDAVELYNQGKDIGNFSFNILKANIRLALIPISILIVFGEPIFILVFGERWVQAGLFASILGAYSLMQFCSGCLSCNFVIIKKQRINLFFSIASVIVNAVALSLGAIILKDVIITMICFVIVNCLLTILDLGLFLYMTGVNIKRYIMFLLIYLISPVSIAIIIRTIIQ